MKVKIVLPVLTEARTPLFRPIKKQVPRGQSLLGRALDLTRPRQPEAPAREPAG